MEFDKDIKEMRVQILNCDGLVNVLLELKKGARYKTIERFSAQDFYEEDDDQWFEFEFKGCEYDLNVYSHFDHEHGETLFATIYAVKPTDNGFTMTDTFSDYVSIPCDHITFKEIQEYYDSFSEEEALARWESDYAIVYGSAEDILDFPPEGLSPNRIWTLLEGDEGTYVSSGYHYVNRMGYIIANRPFLSNQNLTLRWDV